VLSVVSLRAFAAPATLPVAALLDMQRESQAIPQLLATCRIDGSLGNCRRPPRFDASRGNRRAGGCKEALVRQVGNEMATAIVSGVSAEAVEAVALIAATSPRSPRNGKSADG
jgi:hypothetical protein